MSRLRLLIRSIYVQFSHLLLFERKRLELDKYQFIYVLRVTESYSDIILINEGQGHHEGHYISQYSVKIIIYTFLKEID